VKTEAAVLWERGKPLEVESVELAPPGRGEVLVEVKAAGVCHSDLHPARDEWPTRTPVVLGHEGAGVVREIGEGVTEIVAGDTVVFCWAPACGVCPLCIEGRAILCDRLDRTTYRNKLPSGATRLSARGQPIGHFLSTACFASHTVVPAEGAIVVGREDDGTSFRALAMLGCAVVTGVGAVLTAARAPRGSTAVVIGAGGVGLSVLQGCAIAGCARAIAIDRQAAPLSLASRFGATDVVDSAASDAVQAVKDLTGGRGADFVFDTVGIPATLTFALNAARKGGTVVVTGLSRVDEVSGVTMFPFVMQEKRLIGSVYGSGRPAEDIRRLAGWYREGRLKLDELGQRRAGCPGRVSRGEGCNYFLKAANSSYCSRGRASARLRPRSPKRQRRRPTPARQPRCDRVPRRSRWRARPRAVPET
jgi:S-(hydroxymethyl)glutathione dehydrogenase/alcohol dehydrogenase